MAEEFFIDAQNPEITMRDFLCEVYLFLMVEISYVWEEMSDIICCLVVRYLTLIGKKVWYALSCKYTNVLAFPIFIQWTAFMFENS